MAGDTPPTPAPARPEPTPFVPDANRSVEDNVQAFWTSLEQLNPEFARLLRNTLPTLLPLPDAGPLRNTRRVQANRAVETALDAPRAPQGAAQ